MTTFPHGIARYTGANTFAAEDAAGNVFYVFQKQQDTGCVVIVRPDGIATELMAMPGSGRPALECNPTVGLWVVGNKETPATQPPTRYPIAEYVPFTTAVGEKGDPGPPGTPGAGGVILLPHVVTNPAWEGRVLTTGVLVDIPVVFGVPVAQAYLVRFVVTAPAANVRGRAGTQSCPFFFTVNTQAAGVDAMQQGWVPGPQCWISPAQGTPTVWVQIVGHN